MLQKGASKSLKPDWFLGPHYWTVVIVVKYVFINLLWIKTINFNHSVILLCSCPNCPKLLPKSCPLLLWRRPKTFLRSFGTNKSTLLWRQLKLVTISSAIWDGVVRSTVQRRLDSEKDLSSCNILLDGGGVTVTWNCRKLLPTPAPCFGSFWAASLGYLKPA